MGFDYDSLPAHMKEKVDKAQKEALTRVIGRGYRPTHSKSITSKAIFGHIEREVSPTDKLPTGINVKEAWIDAWVDEYPIALATPPAPDKMNKTEQRLEQHLANQKLAGEILWYKMHGFGMRLADNTFFYPDAMVMENDRSISIYDAKAQNRSTGKGLWKDDAKVKIKVAAELFPIFRFRGISYTKKNGWVIEEYSR